MSPMKPMSPKNPMNPSPSFLAGLLPIVALLMVQVSVMGQPIEIHREASSLWIEGRSNLHPFACVAAEFGAQTIVNEDGAKRGMVAGGVSGVVEVEIRTDSFDCGKRRMNHDLREALKANEHQVIQFEYEELLAFRWVKVSGVEGSGMEVSDKEMAAKEMAGKEIRDAEGNVLHRRFVMRVAGSLTVAGVTRRVEVDLEGVQLGQELVQAQGKTELVMSDYAIDPPKALLGLIEVRDHLTVHFDLLASVR